MDDEGSSVKNKQPCDPLDHCSTKRTIFPPDLGLNCVERVDFTYIYTLFFRKINRHFTDFLQNFYYCLIFLKILKEIHPLGMRENQYLLVFESFT